MLQYYMRVEHTALLGFGNRCVLWVYGCSKDPPCPGCIAQQKEARLIKTESESDVADWVCGILASDGITISGGEPFDQAKALAEMLRCVKQTKGESFSVIIYTGRLYESLLELAKTDQGVADLLSFADILIDGPYIDELDDDIPYRGSSNQRILVLNPAFQAAADAYYTTIPGRKIEMIATQEYTMMIGVPSAEQAAMWKTILSLTS